MTSNAGRIAVRTIAAAIASIAAVLAVLVLVFGITGVHDDAGDPGWATGDLVFVYGVFGGVALALNLAALRLAVLALRRGRGVAGALVTELVAVMAVVLWIFVFIASHGS